MGWDGFSNHQLTFYITTSFLYNMSEFREKVGIFYNNHPKGLEFTRKVAGWICGMGVILVLGFVMLGIAGSIM